MFCGWCVCPRCAPFFPTQGHSMSKPSGTPLSIGSETPASLGIAYSLWHSQPVVPPRQPRGEAGGRKPSRWRRHPGCWSTVARKCVHEYCESYTCRTENAYARAYTCPFWVPSCYLEHGYWTRPWCGPASVFLSVDQVRPLTSLDVLEVKVTCVSGRTRERREVQIHHHH